VENGDLATGTVLQAWWIRAASGAQAGPTFTDPGNHTIGLIFSVRGCIATGDPFDVIATDNTQSGTSGACPSVITTVPNCLIVGLASTGFDTAADEFSGWASSGGLASFAEFFNENTLVGNGGGISGASGVKATAGATGTLTYSLANTSPQAAMTIAFKPVADSAPTATVPIMPFAMWSCL
jgi:hypothetical protein